MQKKLGENRTTSLTDEGKFKDQILTFSYGTTLLQLICTFMWLCVGPFYHIGFRGSLLFFKLTLLKCWLRWEAHGCEWHRIVTALFLFDAKWSLADLGIQCRKIVTSQLEREHPVHHHDHAVCLTSWWPSIVQSEWSSIRLIEGFIQTVWLKSWATLDLAISS